MVVLMRRSGRSQVVPVPHELHFQMKVMVVDDDASVRNALSKVLSDAGYEPVLAADGREALKRFDAKQIGLLLLDLGLPRKSGWDTFEQITRSDPALPIIIITGQTEEYDTAVAAGVGAFMEKPLDADQLLDTMKRLLAEPKEARLRRLLGCGGVVTRVPSTSAQLLQHLKDRETAPLRFPYISADGTGDIR